MCWLEKKVVVDDFHGIREVVTCYQDLIIIQSGCTDMMTNVEKSNIDSINLNFLISI